MGYITGTDSRQMTLAIGCVEDEVSQDSPAWFIAAFVDGLDLKRWGSSTPRPRPRAGRLTTPATW